MTIVSSAFERRAMLDRIDQLKIEIADLQLEIDAVWLSFPLPPRRSAELLAEADIHFTRARVELNAAQLRIAQL